MEVSFVIYFEFEELVPTVAVNSPPTVSLPMVTEASLETVYSLASDRPKLYPLELEIDFSRVKVNLP